MDSLSWAVIICSALIVIAVIVSSVQWFRKSGIGQLQSRIEPPQPRNGPLQKLDPEMLNNIMRLLDLEQMENVRKVNRDFNQVYSNIQEPWSVFKFRLTDNAQSNLRSSIGPNGSTVAVGDELGIVRLYDSKTGRPLSAESPLYSGKSAITAVRYSPDGNIVAVGDREGTVSFCDVATGTRAHASERHLNKVNSISFSASGGTSGPLAISCSIDSSFRIWNPTTGQLVGKYGYLVRGPMDGGKFPMSVTDARINATGTQVATLLALGAVTMFDIKEMERSESSTTPAESPVSRNGENDFTLQRWSTKTRHEPTSVAFRPGGHLVAVGDVSGKLTLMFAKKRDAQVWKILMNPSAILSVCFSPDGTILASGDVTGVVRLWDIMTGQVVRTLAPRIDERPIGKAHSVDIVTDYAKKQPVLFCGFDNGFVVWTGPLNKRQTIREQRLL